MMGNSIVVAAQSNVNRQDQTSKRAYHAELPHHAAA
jgi:hypothetical protein